jgi:hypothetical protein
MNLRAPKQPFGLLVIDDQTYKQSQLICCFCMFTVVLITCTCAVQAGPTNTPTVNPLYLGIGLEFFVTKFAA